MAEQAGNGVLLTKGLEMLTFCQLNNRKFEFRNFYVSDDSTNITYNDIISPTGTFNNKLVEELVASSSFSEVYGPEPVGDNGSFLSGSTYTEIPISLPIPVNALASNENFREIYVTARDSSVDVNLIVSDLTNFAIDDTVTGGDSGATGVIVYTYDDGVDKRVYLKSVSTVNKFTPTESVTSTSGGSASCTAIETPTKVKLTTHNFELDDIVVGVTSGATGKVYKISAITGGYDIYLINVDGIFEVGENIWVVNDSTTTRAIQLVTDYAPEFVMYNTCLKYDDAVDADTAASILSVPYIANGSDFNLNITIEQVVGVVPSSYTFTDSRSVEIFTHDNLNTAHNTTHLRLDGGNSPSANVSWGDYKITDLGDATGATDALPYGQISTITTSTIYVSTRAELVSTLNNLAPLINNPTTIIIDEDASDFNDVSLTIENFSGSEYLTIRHSASTQTNKLNSINIVDCSCKIYLDGFEIYGNSTYGVYINNCRYVYIDDVVFENCSVTAAINATRNSYVRCSDVIMKGQNNIKAVKSDYSSKVICGNMKHNASTDYCTSLAFDATYDGVISKPTYFTVPTYIIKSNTNEYSKTQYGGKIYGYWGDGQSFDYTEDVTDQLTIIAETITASGINNALLQAGPYIPYNRRIVVKFDDGTGGQYDTASYQASGFYGEGTLVFSTVEASPTLTLTHTAIGSTDYAFYFSDNSCKILVEKLTGVFGTSGGVVYVFLENNKNRVIFSDVDFRGTENDGATTLGFNYCNDVLVTSSTIGFNSGTFNAGDSCLTAYGAGTNVEVYNCDILNGGTGLSAYNGARIIETGSSTDSETNVSKYELYAVNGGDIRVTGSYSYDGSLNVYADQGGTVICEDTMYCNAHTITFS